MIQHNKAADFGALALNNPVEGLATVVKVVRVSSDSEHKLHMLVSNATGDQWVYLAPSITAHATLQTDDVIRARFTVHQGIGKSRTWATGLRVHLAEADDPDALPEPDPLRELARASRTNRRLLIHGLALAALASEFVREGSHFDVLQAKDQLFAAIQTLPPSEVRLLIQAAIAWEL